MGRLQWEWCTQRSLKLGHLPIDTAPPPAKLSLMEVNFHPETESRLRELAERTGRAPSDLVEDATACYLKKLSRGLAAIHIAEYNALTNRITYYVTLQYATWGTAAVLFGSLVASWSTVSSHRGLGWLALICLLAVSWAVLHINFEMFVIVRYLKEELLKSMAFDAGVRLEEVMGFEGWIRNRGRLEDFHRNQAPTLIFGVGFAVLAFLLLKDIVYGSWAYADAGWLVLFVSLAAVVCVKIWGIWVLSRQLQK